MFVEELCKSNKVRNTPVEVEHKVGITTTTTTTTTSATAVLVCPFSAAAKIEDFAFIEALLSRSSDRNKRITRFLPLCKVKQ